MNNAKKVTKISKTPVSNPNFTHQFESLRNKARDFPLLIHLFLCLCSNSDVNFNVATTESSITCKNNVMNLCRRSVPKPHQFDHLIMQIEHNKPRTVPS